MAVKPKEDDDVVLEVASYIRQQPYKRYALHIQYARTQLG